MATLRQMFPRASSMLVAALCMAVLAVPAWAQVTTANDSGTGSLRAATAAAAPGSTITFDPSLNGLTIQIGTSLLINKNLVIDAAGLPNGITVLMASNAPVIRLFAGATLELNSITVSRGNTGIENYGQLTLKRCKVIESGIGLLNDVAGTLAMMDSTISDCQGPGIVNHGSLSVSRCAIFRGSPNSSSQAIYNTPQGTASVRNSTLSGNIQAIANGGTLHLKHSTVAGNTGGTAGIANMGGTLTVENSIVANNGSLDISGGYVAAGVNIVESESPRHTGAGKVLAVDPLLGPLGNWGGPTQSMRPKPRSPAIDAAPHQVTEDSLDQRGFARISGEGLDIGAIEQIEVLVNTTADEDDGMATGGISLRDALAATGPGKVELIRFDPTVFPATIQLGSQGLEIPNREMTIDARGIDGEVVIKGNGAASVFKIQTGSNVALRGLTITGGGGSGGGGVWLGGGSTGFIDRCSIHSNNAYRGGGIMNGGTLHVVNSTIAGNQARYTGGGIEHSGSVYLLHCTIAGNTANSMGGGVYLFSGYGECRNTIVAGNLPDDFGGGSTTFKGRNLISDVDGSGASASNAALIIRAPLLAPLGRYGSNSPTMPPLPGSAAINGAVTAADLPLTDQSGNPRISGNLPDIGAVEALPLGALGLASVDGDTIPDILEGSTYAHLSPQTDDSEMDSDGDGRTDAEEITGMTDPKNPADFFRVLSLQPGQGFHPEANPLFEVTIKTFPGLSYHLATGAGLEDLEPVMDSGFVADDFAETLEVLLPVGRGFLRVRPGEVPNE